VQAPKREGGARHGAGPAGKVQEEREPFAPVYEGLTEGFDTRDLKETTALLEEMTGR
jgi:hypothetical protein